MPNWLRIADAKYINNSPSKMARDYGLVFADGNGDPQANADWLLDPDISAVAGWDEKYWLTPCADPVVLMDQTARDAVDAAEAQAAVDAERQAAVEAADSLVGYSAGYFTDGVQFRELIELFNKRDNYIINRLIELQTALADLAAATGNAGSRIDQLPASYLPTQTRTRAEAIQAYKDDINAGGADV